MNKTRILELLTYLDDTTLDEIKALQSKALRHLELAHTREKR